MSNDYKFLDSAFWESDALRQLHKVVGDNIIENKAKNVVIFVGDGMGIATITAGRIYKGQKLSQRSTEGYKLSFEQFPFSAFSKVSFLIGWLIKLLIN